MGCHAFRGKAGAGLRLARRALAGVCPHVSACVWARHVCRREEPTFQTPGRQAYRGLAPRILFCPQVPPSSPAKTRIDVVIADAFLLSPVEARGQSGNTSGVKSGHPEPHSRLEAPPGSFPAGDRASASSPAGRGACAAFVSSWGALEEEPG